MHDLIKADRTDNWNLHVKFVHKLQLIFYIMDCINYARWGAIYLEDILQVEKITPEVYEQFLKGRFQLRDQIPLLFTSVATDQGLKQTINRASKSSGGVIGSTKKKSMLQFGILRFTNSWVFLIILKILLASTTMMMNCIYIGNYLPRLL